MVLIFVQCGVCCGVLLAAAFFDAPIVLCWRDCIAMSGFAAVCTGGVVGQVVVGVHTTLVGVHLAR